MITTKYKIGLALISSTLLANSTLAQCANIEICSGNDEIIQLITNDITISSKSVPLEAEGINDQLLQDGPEVGTLPIKDNTASCADITDDNISSITHKQLRKLKLFRSSVGVYPTETPRDRKL